ncbi:16789_t:CDS:2 [Acaulospora morrowiae]|uniref:16789_t:CDS:1 n=1 Tax=Acaulospora morrowiae TaxID=94023 RepID=A0A9N9GY18_9GLOM|nr:16789_t:CDS:2 [Acaulospora morrowiae]
MEIVKNIKRACCGEPELSVMIGGDINGLDYEEVSERIKNATTFNFVHVVKKKDKGFGFVHFESRKQAAIFFHDVKEKDYYYGDEKGPMRFFAATYFNTSRKVEYNLDETNCGTNNERKNVKGKRKAIEIIEISDDDEKEINKSKILKYSRAAYGLFKNDNTYIIILHTPGIVNKSDLVISSVDDRSFAIKYNLGERIISGREIINFLPTGLFKADVELPSE